MAKGNRIAVLFDLEDTLVQTPWENHQHVIEFRCKTREKLVALGIPLTILQRVERATLMRNKASEYIEQNFTQAEAKRFNQRMDKFLSQYELDSAKKSKLFPDTVATLEMLRKLRTKTGLVTNTSQKAVTAIFQKHGLKKYFDIVVTRESVKRLKPDPEGILYAVKELRARHFFMVGDLVLDALATKSAKGTAILVKRNPGESDLQYLFKSLPPEVHEKTKESSGIDDLQVDYVVQSLNEVPPIVQKAMKEGSEK